MVRQALLSGHCDYVISDFATPDEVPGADLRQMEIKRCTGANASLHSALGHLTVGVTESPKYLTKDLNLNSAAHHQHCCAKARTSC